MTIELNKQENRTGDPDSGAQGFNRVSKMPAPLFDPVAERQAAGAFFEERGYVVLNQCLSSAELAHLNDFFDRTQRERPNEWGLGDQRKPHHRDQGLIYSQPLLDYPELDQYTQHAASYPLVCDLLGGEDRPRFCEFNLRETPENAGLGAMNFHHDKVSEDRLLRAPYNPVDWLCAIHYLTDVDETTPSFCVVPYSNRFETLKDTHEKLGDQYVEQPLHAPAGSCVLYDTATHHTRLDGDGHKRRRTWHQYYARGGFLRSSLPTTDRYVRSPSPALTDWNLFPERLAMHADPVKRRFFSHWNTAQGEWVASGFDEEFRSGMPRGRM